jgi:hypothetical protein
VKSESHNRPLVAAVSAAAIAVAGLAAAGSKTHSAPAGPIDPPAITEPVIGTITPTASGWVPVVVVDVNKFPLDTHPRYHSKSQTFFTGPNKMGLLVYAVWSPSWDTKMPRAGMPPHFHYYHEWGYTLKGDSVLPEPVSPYQKNGMLYRKREGGWLSRPAFSLHGGSWETGGMRAQFPYHLLIFEEGDGSLVTVGPNGDHIKPDFPGEKPDPYLPDWTAVKNFTRPWLVDSQRDLEWEEDPQVPGRFIKWLSDDMADGFRAQLVKIPPGWKPPAGAARTYFAKANRLRFMVSGDLTVWSFKSPQDPGQGFNARENTFIYQPPRSLWGYGQGEVTKEGAVWLEVTYARGLSVGSGPIEEPVAAE